LLLRAVVAVAAFTTAAAVVLVFIVPVQVFLSPQEQLTQLP